MKLFLTANDDNISGVIDSSFGRCAFFLIYETEDDSFEFIENSYQDDQTSVGAAVAKKALELGVESVLSVNPGPRAFNIFKDSEIKVYHVPDGTKLKDAILSFSKNKLAALDAYLPRIE